MQSLQQLFNLKLKSLISGYHLNVGKIAAAVSGGADSLALAFLLKGFIDENGGELSVLTVNHHLRPEACEEVRYVADLMNRHSISVQILDWKHEPLSAGIETKARKARYDLLTGWCRRNDTGVLLTAHHLRDQAETFVMRLQRGSGVDGLASIEPVTERDGIVLLRPLLSFEPDELKKFLLSKSICWKEDASNGCDDFLRVRVRKLLPLLEKELGLTTAKIGAAAAALSGAKTYFAAEAERFISRNCHNWYQQGWSFSPSAFAALHDELKFRVLARLIKAVGGCEYTPEYTALCRLRQSLAENDFSGCTLGYCEIFRWHGKIWIIPEHKTERILERRQWEDYAARHFSELKAELPYKLRLILFEKNSKAVEFEK